MNIDEGLHRWLQIEYYCMSRRLGFINKQLEPDYQLIVDTIRCLDYQTTIINRVSPDKIIAILALMWEHVDKKQYDLRELVIKILSRIGYSTSAIIADKDYNHETNQFSPICSVLDKVTLTLQQARYEISVGNKICVLTDFQKRFWNALECKKILGVSAPTSAGKSYVIQLDTARKMLKEKLDVIYIVPTLSLLNQVVEDYHVLLTQVGITDYIITSNLMVGESKAAHMFNRYIPEEYRWGTSRGILCRESIRWAIEVPLSEFFKDEFYSAGDIQLKIEDKIQMLQKTASFDIPLLIKPVVEMKNPASTIVSSLQAGAYKKTTKKMIDIGIPRELAIRLNSMLKESRNSEKLDNYDYEQWVRKSVLKIKPTLSYWEQAQLEFLGD